MMKIIREALPPIAMQADVSVAAADGCEPDTDAYQAEMRYEAAVAE